MENKKNKVEKIVGNGVLLILVLILNISFVFSSSLVYNEDFEDANEFDSLGTNYQEFWDDSIILYMDSGDSLRMVVNGDGISGFPYTAGEANCG